ncbi:MAG: lipopolysaccharide heptosyltransferase II [Proteobacteria bacterium]|nr:lipopolysaccharide heptosyltransferase II [Pseudomonadota bacterium]
MNAHEVKKILVVGPAWVGDMVMAQSLFQRLKQQSPSVVIDVLAPAWSEPLLARMPEVRRAHTLPFMHGELKLIERHRIACRLRAERYDRAIVLPNSFKSALIPFWANIPRRTGYRGELRWGLLNDVRQLDKKMLPQTVQRFVALGLPKNAAQPPQIQFPQLHISSGSAQAALSALRLEHPSQPLLALCPGAEYGPAKRWPTEYFADVARTKIAQGWSVWIFGSAHDKTIAAEICAQAGEECVDLSGRTSLAQAIDLLSLTDLVLTNDSGMMHVAAALGRKLVAVYGSSDPGFTPPLSSTARVVWLKLACSPCFERKCPLVHLNCLREIKPERVLAEMAALIPS